MKNNIVKLEARRFELEVLINDYDHSILNEHRDKSRKTLLMKKRELSKSELYEINNTLKS